MRTCSHLGPCGYADVLSAKRVRSKSSLRAVGLGKTFHGGAETWIKTGQMPALKPAQVADWLAGLASSFVPPPGVETEVALGLSPNGRYVAVTEDPPDSHIYKPNDPTQTLLTAGRADLVWTADDCTYVPDYKTGRFAPESPITPQLMALGLAVADRAGTGHMALGLYLAREVEWRWSDAIALDSEEAARMWDVVQLYAGLGPEPRVGPWCGTCWEKEQCEAVNAR